MQPPVSPHHLLFFFFVQFSAPADEEYKKTPKPGDLISSGSQAAWR